MVKRTKTFCKAASNWRLLRSFTQTEVAWSPLKSLWLVFLWLLDFRNKSNPIQILHFIVSQDSMCMSGQSQGAFIHACKSQHFLAKSQLWNFHDYTQMSASQESFWDCDGGKTFVINPALSSSLCHQRSQNTQLPICSSETELVNPFLPLNIWCLWLYCYNFSKDSAFHIF